MNTTFDPSTDPAVKVTGDRLSKHTQDLKNDAGKVAQDLGDHAAANVDYAQGKADEAMDELSIYAKKNLLTFLASGFGIGCVLGVVVGFLIARR